MFAINTTPFIERKYFIKGGNQMKILDEIKRIIKEIRKEGSEIIGNDVIITSTGEIIPIKRS